MHELKQLLTTGKRDVLPTWAFTMELPTNKEVLPVWKARAALTKDWWGLFYGTERNDGLNHETERFLNLKLEGYHCC